MSDSDTPEPSPAPTTMGTFAQRIMARWHTTPVTTTVQRAVSARPTAGIGQSGSAQTLVQRITERQQPLTAWHAKATSTETAVEAFTDKVVQRFPDYGAKYLPRTEETDSPPSKDVDMVFSGGRATSSAADTSNAQEQSRTSAFDPDSLPSVPPEILARHLKNRQAPTESAAAKAPVQRKATPPDPKLVRPRSRVDYFGSTTAPTPIAPVNTSSTSTETIQAKADESVPATPAEPEVLPDTPLIEQPTFRTRPRAGFQTIPTKNMSAPPGEGSKNIPFVPLQLKAEPEASTPGTAITDAPSSPTDTPTQRVADDEKGSDDETPPSNDVPPSGPPPPPAPVSPNEPLQRIAAEPSETPLPVEMPLRQQPDEPSESRPSDNTPLQRQSETQPAKRLAVDSPIQRQSDNQTPSNAVTLPPLTSAIPAKVVRRKMAAPAPEQVRKPVVYNSSTSVPSISPVQRQIADTISTLPASSGNVAHTPSSRTTSVSADIETQSYIPQRNDMPLVSSPVSEAPQADTPIQRMVDTDVAMPPALVASGTESTVAINVPTVVPSVTSDAPLQRRAVEPSAPNVEANSGISSSSVAPTNANVPPVQRKVTDTDIPALTDNPTISVAAQSATVPPVPSRTDMPLREADAATPIQRQVEEVPSASNATSTTQPHTVASAEMSSSRSSTPPIQRQTEPTPATGQESNITPHVESSTSATPPIQRKSASVPVASVAQTHTVSSPIDTPTAPIQRAVAGENITGADSSESAPPSSYVNETRSEVDTPPLQRQVDSTVAEERDAVAVEATSVSPAVLHRADMPLRMPEDTSPNTASDTPIQRQVVDVAQTETRSPTGDSASVTQSAASITTGAAASVPGTDAPIQRQVSDPIAAEPTIAKSTVLSTPQSESTITAATTSATGTDAPIQRQAAERVSVSPQTPPTPFEMPLRVVDTGADTPSTTAPLQRQIEAGAVPTTVPTESITATPIQRQPLEQASVTRDITPVTVDTPSLTGNNSTVTPTATAPIQRQATESTTTANDTVRANALSTGTIADAPIQRQPSERVSVEIPLSDGLPEHVEMPLRLSDTPSATPPSTPIQRQADSAAPVQATVANEGVTQSNSSIAIQRQAETSTPEIKPQSTSGGESSVPTTTPSVSSSAVSPAPVQRMVLGNESSSTSVASDAPLRASGSPFQTAAAPAVEMPLRLNETPSVSDTETVQRRADNTQSAATSSNVTSTLDSAVSAPGASNTNVVQDRASTNDSLPLQRKVDTVSATEATPSAPNTPPLQRKPESTSATEPIPLVPNTLPLQRKVDTTSAAEANMPVDPALPLQRKTEDSTREITQAVINRTPAADGLDMPLRAPANPVDSTAASPSVESVSASSFEGDTSPSSTSAVPMQRKMAEPQGNTDSGQQSTVASGETSTPVQRVGAEPQANSTPLQRVTSEPQGSSTPIQRTAAQTTSDTMPLQVQATPVATERPSRAEMPLRESDPTLLSNDTIQRQADGTQVTSQITTNETGTSVPEVSTAAFTSPSNSDSGVAPVASPANDTIQRVAATPAVTDSQPSLDAPVRVTPSVVISPDAPDMPLRADAPLQRQVAEDTTTAITTSDTPSSGGNIMHDSEQLGFVAPNTPTVTPVPAAPIQRRTVDNGNEAVAPRITAEPQSRPAETSDAVPMPLRALPTDAPVQRRADKNTNAVPASSVAAESAPSSITTPVEAAITVGTTTLPATSIPSTPVVADALPIQRKSEANIENTPVQRLAEGVQTPAVKATPTVQATTLPDMPLRTTSTADSAVVQRQIAEEAQEFSSPNTATPAIPTLPTPNVAQRTATQEATTNSATIASAKVTPNVVQRAVTPDSISNEATVAPTKVTATHAESVQRVEMPLHTAPELSGPPNTDTPAPLQRTKASTADADATENTTLPIPAPIQRVSAAPQTPRRAATPVVQRKVITNGTPAVARTLRVTAQRSRTEAAPALPLAQTTDTVPSETTIQRALSTPTPNDSDYATEYAMPVARVAPTLQRNDTSRLPRTLRHVSQEGSTHTALTSDTSPIQRQPTTTSTHLLDEDMPLAGSGPEPLTIDLTNDPHFTAWLNQQQGGSTENSTTPATTASTNTQKEPSESDTQRALETLARQIYPLLKQMLQRDRERHRGF